MKISLGTAHEAGFALAMTASIAIVLLGGELPAFAWLVCLAPWLSFGLSVRRVSPPALSATLVGLGAIVLGSVTLVRGGLESSVLAGAEILMGLLTARLLVRRTPGHDLQAISLSLLLVLAGSVLNVKITYIAVFIVYAVSAVWALSTRQLLAGAFVEEGPNVDRRRVLARADIVTPGFFLATAGIAVAVLATAAVVFAAFPRVGFGDIGAFMRKDKSRLPGAVGLRGDPRLGGGNDVVARAFGVPREAFERGLYLRGAVYDVVNLDGFLQSSADTERGWGFVELADAPQSARYELNVMPVVGDTLLSLGGVTAMRVLGGGTANPNIALGVAGKSTFDEEKAMTPLNSAMRYEVAGGVSAPGYVPTTPHRPPKAIDRARWLKLPQDFDDGLLALARQVVGEGATTPSAKARMLRRFFLGSFRYSQQPPRFATSPLRTFLLEEREAHCEYFAAGFALLLRSVGVPARVVGGFQGGAWDDGVVVFAEKNAHAWVEWWDDDAGWIVDDGTPLANAPREELSGVDTLVERARRFWDDQVLDYSLQEQSDAVAQARRSWQGVDPSLKALGVGVAVPVLVAGVVLLARRRRRRRETALHPLAVAILDAVARTTQVPVAPSSTLREAVVSAGGVDDAALRTALEQALATYERDRFGGASVNPVEVRVRARALQRAVRGVARHGAGPGLSRGHPEAPAHDASRERPRAR